MIRRLLRSLFLAGVFVMLCGCGKGSDDSGDLVFMWFDVEGNVVDTAGLPIEGITVSAESTTPVKTDVKGYFSIRGGGAPASKAALYFADDDDTDGYYRSKTVTVELVKYKAGEGWAEGFYRNKNEVLVTLVQDAVITPAIPGVEASQGAEQ